MYIVIHVCSVDISHLRLLDTALDSEGPLVRPGSRAVKAPARNMGFALQEIRGRWREVTGMRLPYGKLKAEARGPCEWMREKYFELVVSFQRPSDLIASGRPFVCKRERPITKSSIGKNSCCFMELGKPARIWLQRLWKSRR